MRPVHDHVPGGDVDEVFAAKISRAAGLFPGIVDCRQRFRTEGDTNCLCEGKSSAVVRAKEKKRLFPCFFGMLELNVLLLIRVYLGCIVEGVICSIRWRYDGFQQEVNISCRNLVLKAGAFHVQRENPRGY